MTDKPVADREKFQAIGECIGLLTSAIKSGEPWTPTCAEVKAKALLALEALATQQPSDDGAVIGTIIVHRKGHSSVDLDASHADLAPGTYTIRASQKPIAETKQQPTDDRPRLPKGYEITQRNFDLCLSKDGYSVISIPLDRHRNPSFNKELAEFFEAFRASQKAGG